MPIVVAVQVWYWMTNFQNGILNYVLNSLPFGDYSQHDWYASTSSQLGLVTSLIVWGPSPSSRSASTRGSHRSPGSSSRLPRWTARGLARLPRRHVP